MTKPIRSLPPGVDTIDEDVIFGTMWIKVGTIKLIRTTNASYNVLCQFWGETAPVILATRNDTPNNQQQRTQKYNIKCPVTFFGEYLQEMKNNLRLDVEGVGKISLDISKFLKKNISIDSRSAFQHFKGFFEIIGKGNRKAGSLEIQMGCEFDPQIAIRQLGQSGVEQIRKNQIINCPAEKLQVKKCCGHCECICPKPPRKVRIKEQKNQIVQDDPRIPNSLNTKPRQQSSYDGKKYESVEQVQLKLPTPKASEDELKGKINKVEEFPEVPKILTYSNLRLNYDDPELQSQIKKQREPQIQYRQEPKMEPTKDEPKLLPSLQSRKENNIGSSVEDSRYQIKAKPQISKQQLLKQFYGAENSPFKANQDPIQQRSQDNFFKDDQSKLSRVVNLNEQFNHMNKIRPPPLLATQSLERPVNHQENIRFQMGKRPNKSNLMLNLFVELRSQSVALPVNQKYVIAYRPYGQKQRLTLGPNFPEKIEIHSTVGQNQIRKMGKTPFIIQFWSATQTKFLGLIKIDLNKIKHGFLLQDRLNEMAIKTNILPTTIERGSIKILDLFDKQVGECNLYAGIGTANQLNAYLNQKQNNASIKKQQQPIKKQEIPKKIEDPQKEQKPKDNPEPKAEEKNLMESFDNFLEKLYKNNNKLIDSLNRMMNQQYISINEFTELSKSISFTFVNKIYEIHKKITQNKSQIDFHQIADSFDDYIEIIQQIKDQFALSAKVVRNLFSDPKQVVAQITEKTPIKVINKKKAQQIMQKYTRYHGPITDYLNKFTQYINVENLCDALQNQNQEFPELSQISKDYINQLITQRVLNKLSKQNISFEKLGPALQNVSSVSIFSLFKLLQGNVSLWALLHWVESMNKKHNRQINDQISVDILKNYWKQNPKQQQIKPKIEEVPQKQKQQEQQIKNPKKEQPVLPQESILQKRQEAPKKQQREVQPKIDDIKQPEVLPKPEQKKQEEKQFYKHLFSIQPKELSLDHPIKGNCVVIYEFPFDEEQVKSKSFMAAIDKHKYPLQMYGTHALSIQEPIENYIGDNSIKFFVRIDKRIEYQGALPSDELLIDPNTEQDKIIPLFSDRSEGIAGKIKMNINYERALAAQCNLGKQTTYQLFLPKTGYLNYSLSSQLQPSKIRSQLNLKQQFYVSLVLDIFYNNPTLRTQFPPISSKLYSDNTQLMQMVGAIKLSLTPVVLEFLKTKSARLSLNITYYSKQSGNFERKEIPFAIIELPLINVIKTGGIKGDYAFKNKLGMFVTLANCSLKYEKDPLTKVAHKQENVKHLTSYWLILNFVEFLNFEMNKFTWIRMEFVVKGRKYATDKIHLEPYSVNFLNNAAILIKFNQEQFIDTKVIPVTIITNTSEKLAIDINLKAISRDVAVKKYSINNQNYVVVNHSSRPTKMRLALKTYCFRGGPLLTNFVNSLYQHLDTEVFDELEYPEQPDNYQEVVNIWKNKLKLTQKGLNQVLSELDIGGNKSKLNFEFFTNRTYYKLDFTPILAQNEADIDFLCQELPTEASKQDILDYFKNNKINLQNFRQEFLDRFLFKQLNKIKADKNIEFLGIDNQIDLISFVRKIKILGESSIQNQTSVLEQKMIEITVLEGSNFQQLYNGIKPNAIVRIPDIGLQTQVSHRNSSPYFNESTLFELDKDNLTMLRNLRVEVYHCTAEDDDAENILIGEGHINVNIAELKRSPKIIKVILNSLMSRNMKGTLNIKVGLSNEKRQRSKDQISNQHEQSADVSRLGQILQDMRHQMATKHKLFQSSDEEY